jgi:uncharacterized protein DUF4031
MIPARVGRITSRWSHMTADTKEELIAFAERIGLKAAWFQTCKRSARCRPPERCVHWHFDVTEGKRLQALAAGAVAFDNHGWSELIAKRRLAEADPS